MLRLNSIQKYIPKVHIRNYSNKESVLISSKPDDYYPGLYHHYYDGSGRVAYLSFIPSSFLTGTFSPHQFIGEVNQVETVVKI